MSSQLFKFNLSKDNKIKKPILSSDKQIIKPEKKLVLTDETFIRLRDEIYELSGIYYTENKKYLLEGRIIKRIISKNFKSYEEYMNFLKSPAGKHELKYLFEAITINETYFFRAETQFDAFQKTIVPEMLKDRLKTLRNPIFRIWSAASSSGEEAYTLALIVLEKLKPLYPNVQFQIVASDINNAVLEAARKGVFKEYAIRNVNPIYMNKYFKKDGNQFLLNDEVKKMVRFINLNLYDASAMKTIINCDVIFCANVLIYFDVPSKQKVVSYLYNAMTNGGYLFIGHSESLHGISKAFKLIHLPKAMAYKKD